MNRTMKMLLVVGASAAILAIVPRAAGAHCDGLDGPVVKAARLALERHDVNDVLIWVRPEAEHEVRELFRHTVEVRGLGPQATQLADTYFFENVVRLHRAGEREPFTGLKPAGRDLGPAIPAADLALETGDLAPVQMLLGSAIEEGVRQRFETVRKACTFAHSDIGAGRRYVGGYVAFIHYVDGVMRAATGVAAGHEGDEAIPASEHRRSN